MLSSLQSATMNINGLNNGIKQNCAQNCHLVAADKTDIDIYSLEAKAYDSTLYIHEHVQKRRTCLLNYTLC